MADRWELPQNSEMQSSSGTCFSNSGLLKATAQRGKQRPPSSGGGCWPLAVSPTFSHAPQPPVALHCFAQQLGARFGLSQGYLFTVMRGHAHVVCAVQGWWVSSTALHMQQGACVNNDKRKQMTGAQRCFSVQAGMLVCAVTVI